MLSLYQRSDIMYFKLGNVMMGIVEIESSLDLGGLQIPQRLNFHSGHILSFRWDIILFPGST